MEETEILLHSYRDEVFVPQGATETSSLLDPSTSYAGTADTGTSLKNSIQDWRDGLAAFEDVPHTWSHEIKTLASYAAPIILTSSLQYAIDVSSIIAAGRIGKVELGAVSLANVSSNITCWALFQGLAASLDTLCAQAYGSGEKHLIGLYCQRMTLFLLCVSIPISTLWFFSEPIIIKLVTDPATARLAALYLKILTAAIPGSVVFEAGRRFLQAQGLFRATTYIVLIAAPVHITIITLLVTHLGFLGAPLAVVITRTLLPILLILYVKSFAGSQCWGGFSSRAFANWGIMIRLAIPDMIMVEAEWFAFEIMIVFASRFGTDYLAAQSVLTVVSAIGFNLPFPLSIAASTRVGNLVGAVRESGAKRAAKVAVAASLTLASLNALILLTLSSHIPYAFTSDNAVAALATEILPLVALNAILEGLSLAAHGLLRGIGRQTIGGPANIIAHYVVSIPVGVALAFGKDWKLKGLYTGIAGGLAVVSIIEYGYIHRTNWRDVVREAEERNAAG
ncbi:MAG: hypothetical protein HETSPECPRED_003231 [Heterodermia speciosa]|uniref:MATE efflux family protein n=1 Tax=Heterodermia speciosa TaxID=116794 RepID=A0A8H3PJ46_9LECA|nr:MAG: hypothetical protein HETSPECPRED_003231 [Heterodermia speciosa]